MWDLGQLGVRHVPASRALGGLECRRPVNVSHYIPFYFLFCIGHFSLLLEFILFFFIGDHFLRSLVSQLYLYLYLLCLAALISLAMCTFRPEISQAALITCCGG